MKTVLEMEREHTQRMEESDKIMQRMKELMVETQQILDDNNAPKEDNTEWEVL